MLKPPAAYVVARSYKYYDPRSFLSDLNIVLEVDNSSTPTLVAYNASAFLVLMNSSLNPLVYCWRYREIRDIMKRAVKKDI